MNHRPPIAYSQRPDKLSPLSRAVLAHVEKCPNVTLAILFRLYSYLLIDEPHGESNVAIIANAYNRFRSRLSYMVGVGYLARRIEGDVHYYRQGAGVPPPKPVCAPAPAAPAPLDDQPVSAPSYDLMRAPCYVPEPYACMRAGALDYQRYASRGQRC